MSEMVLAANPPAAVAAIATQIKDAQAPEIEQMMMMLADLGEKPAGEAHSGGHSAGMAGHGGMMSDAEMAAHMDATGADAARLYLEGMIKHHQGAIEASDTEIADGTYAPAIELAKTIKTARAAEITEMQALLKNLWPDGSGADRRSASEREPPALLLRAGPGQDEAGGPR